MTAPTTYVSFLVRLWREQSAERPEATADWHGQVEHIQSGQHWSFSTLDDLLSFLRREAAVAFLGAELIGSGDEPSEA